MLETNRSDGYTVTKYSPIIAAKALWQMRIRKRPFVLSHAINSRCNMKCSFCEYWKKEDDEMSLEEILDLLDKARDFGVLVYNAWTVEPLLREELPRILAHAKQLGMVTSLITNGLLLENRIDDLVDLDYLSVSVDGTSSLKDIRGVSLDRIMPGIVKAKEVMDNPVLINCVISGKNQDDIKELIIMANDLGVKISFEPIHRFQDIDNETWENMGIKDIERHQNTIDTIIRMKKQGYPVINSFTYLKMVRELRKKFACHANKIILDVKADGNIENCRVHQEPIGHVSEGLSTVWERTQKLRQETAYKCNKCLFFGYVENSLLYNFNPEVSRNYEWM